ncbi:hypothetical protein OIO90_001043 [Microbotryomycetes sp. JL221]|nr:hypothetical protein OIO90_001043 [Microbotryomycetes sp. JL221]
MGRPVPRAAQTLATVPVSQPPNGDTSNAQLDQDAGMSTAVRRPSPELHSRGGQPHSKAIAAVQSQPQLVAMDLSVPSLLVDDINPHDEIDKGYSVLLRHSKLSNGQTRLPSNATKQARDKHTRQRRSMTMLDDDDNNSNHHGDDNDDRTDEELDTDDEAQRAWITGPTDELVDSLPRPSPLLKARNLSNLPSPAISTTSTSSDLATPEFELPPQDEPHHYTPLLDSTPSRPRPRKFTLSHSAFGSFGTFPSTARSGPIPEPTIISKIKLFFLQLFANIASSSFLLLIVIWALTARLFQAIVRQWKGIHEPRERRPWQTEEYEQRYRNEKVVKDIQYYANECGFDVIEQTVETKDGYLLKMFKVECLKKTPKIHCDGRGGFPVLIQHGLFQSCGSFITSEERSLAFWLAEHGDYQVYLGNNRGVFDMGHARLKRSDPRFWDYNIKELALYDLPAMVDHVRRQTGYDKIAYIGHSQGNATMFCSLAHGMVPELGEKLSVFIALAPAVYAGPLTTGFPFGALKSMKWKTWRRWFGVLDFIPLMRISYDYTPSKPFGLLGYQMFAFLFNWTDKNWLLRRKPKTFRFTPSPVSSASIFWWTGYGGFSTRGCVLDPAVPKWFDHRFPPLAIHHGGLDYLVLTEPLLERLKTHEKDVKVIRVQKLEEGEHCDFFWHIDAVELCFESFLEDIERTRPRYPDEDSNHWSKYHKTTTSSSSDSSTTIKGGETTSNLAKKTIKENQLKVNGDAHDNRAGQDSAPKKSVRMQQDVSQ